MIGKAVAISCNRVFIFYLNRLVLTFVIILAIQEKKILLHVLPIQSVFSS